MSEEDNSRRNHPEPTEVQILTEPASDRPGTKSSCSKKLSILLLVPKDVLLSICSFCDTAELGVLRRLTKSSTAIEETASDDMFWKSYWECLSKDELAHQRFFGRVVPNRGPTQGSLDECLAAHARYGEFASSTPPPTVDQAVDFVAYVASAHSWYKHLSVVVPTSNFQFVATPVAGMRRDRNSEGRCSWIDYRKGDGTEFHYTWQPTERYRQHFGYLAYRRTSVGSTSKTTKNVADEMAALPLSMVSGRCSVPVTACVHSQAESYSMFDSAWRSALESSDWIVSESDFQHMLNRRKWPSMEEARAKLLEEGITPQSRHWKRMTGVFERVGKSFEVMLRYHHEPQHFQPEQLEKKSRSAKEAGTSEDANHLLEIKKLVDCLFGDHLSFATPCERGTFIATFVDMLPKGSDTEWEYYPLKKGANTLEVNPPQLLMFVERAKQWWDMGGAIQSCVQATWGDAAACALEEVPAQSALRSLEGERW